eukprot:14617052-Alexandrium_andersonii.AAC.1
MCIRDSPMAATLDRRARMQALRQPRHLPQLGSQCRRATSLRKPFGRSARTPMHSVVLLLSDPSHRVKARLVERFATFVRLEHDQQNKDNRSPAACLRYYADLACGAGLQALSATAGLLKDAATLDAVGLQLSALARQDCLDLDSPSLLPDLEVAEAAGDFAVALMAARIRT